MTTFSKCPKCETHYDSRFTNCLVCGTALIPPQTANELKAQSATKAQLDALIKLLLEAGYDEAAGLLQAGSEAISEKLHGMPQALKAAIDSQDEINKQERARTLEIVMTGQAFSRRDELDERMNQRPESGF